MYGELGRVVVVGGANLDVVGHSFRPLIERDSNPGYVRRSAGGVARNVAENLARLGISTSLVTAFGNDADARVVRERCERAGVDVSASIEVDLPGSLYLAILDDGGEMALALSDMRPLERLLPEVLEQRRDVLDRADLVVADANLPAQTLSWLATEAQKPILFDPVSVNKAERISALVGSLSAIKCNATEAAALLADGTTVPDDAGWLAQRLLGSGVLAVYVTAGAAGAYYADAAGHGHLPAPVTAVADETGAGDAFTAGVAVAMLVGVSARHAAEFGSVLAGLTLASEHTVSDAIGPPVLERQVERWNQ